MALCKVIQSIASAGGTIESPSESRRSANYMPSVWNYDFVQSFSTEYTEEKYTRQAERLKDDVKRLISGVMDPLATLELIEAIERLGLKYHFEKEIKDKLDIVYKNSNDGWLSDDLYATALRFRLLRQHGHNIPQDVFERFKDEMGKFKTLLCEDVKGLLSLYEASFLGMHGEALMDEARVFTIANLKDLKVEISPSLARKVDHALDMPVHWILTRLEARWFIDTYEQEQDMNSTLLQLAKLDYNIVQSIHRSEVSKLARWWVDLGLGKMPFSRDRLVEHYFWCIGAFFEPQFGTLREIETKIICLITIIDDIYDVYGSLEEVELLTDFIVRWDIKGIDQLPHLIKICLLAMYNTINEIGYEIMKERDFNIIPQLSKEWGDLCKAFLKEAKWYHEGYKPKLEEYLNNAVNSSGGSLMLSTRYFLVTSGNITKDGLARIVGCTCLLVRLMNDLGTSPGELKRGDTLKSIQCYMNETGASEDVAREHINVLVDEAWKTMNREFLENYPISEQFMISILNSVRICHCVYKYGDGHGVPDGSTKDHLMSLLIEPVPLN